MNTQLNPQRLGGYDLFLRAGAVPVPGIDLPVARLGSSATQVSLPEAPLGLQPDTTYFASVRAFNRSGYAGQAAEFNFLTDGDGHPLQVPTPVTNLSARPIAGGGIVVEWDYDELSGLAIADDFQIARQALWAYSGFAPAAVIVPHTPPKRQYRMMLDAADNGPWRVRVLARKGVLAVTAVSCVDVLVDSVAPAPAIVALDAI